MATLSTQPEYPAKGRETRVIFTRSNSAADFMRVWLTDAPTGSARKDRLNASGRSRVQVHEGDNGSSWRETFDKGGTYRLVVQEYTLGASSHGGAHEGDPNAAPSETKVGGEYSLPLYIGQRMTLPCGLGGDAADLVFFIVNDTIRATDLATHAEVTPALKNASSPRMKAATETPGVQAALGALDGLDVSDAIGDIEGLSAEMVASVRAHFTQAGVHAIDDTVNGPATGWSGSSSPEGLAALVTATLQAMHGHFRDQDATLQMGAGYHSGRADFTNSPLFETAGNQAEAYRALADIWRAHEAHRVSVSGSPGLHLVADSTNLLTTPLPAILEIHRLLFAQLALMVPAVPATQSTGAMLLATQVGAMEVSNGSQ